MALKYTLRKINKPYDVKNKIKVPSSFWFLENFTEISICKD